MLITFEGQPAEVRKQIQAFLAAFGEETTTTQGPKGPAVELSVVHDMDEEPQAPAAPKKRGRPAKQRTEPQAPAVEPVVSAPDEAIEPEEIEAPAATIEMATEALKKVNAAKGIETAVKCLQKFGAAKLKLMDPKHYADFIKECEKAAQ